MKTTDIIEFEIQQGWGDFQIVWLIKYAMGKAYNGYLKNGDLIWVEVKEGQATDKLIPFMRLPYRLIRFGDFVDALTKKVPPTKQEEIDAELKATKYHLEDMRKLLKLKVSAE